MTAEADLIRRGRTAAYTRGACRGVPPAWFFPERTEGDDNHGDAAKQTCAVCPVREECLVSAVLANEPAGIWGGAGEQTRRTLRAARGDEEKFARILAAHFRRLDGAQAWPRDRELLQAFGAAATHGRRCTQAKGCRCSACLMAASYEGLTASWRRGAA